MSKPPQELQTQTPLPKPSPESHGLETVHNMLTVDFEGQEPDVFFSFSGGIGKSPVTGDYQSLTYSSLSEHGIATGSRTRVIATEAVAEALPDVPIVTNSFNRFDPEEPTMASVIRAELVKRGVANDRIQEETQSFSTITQLTEMVKLSVEKGWSRIAVMTNEYHEPRMRAMYENLDTIVDDAEFQKTLALFKEQGKEVALVPAEPIMRAISPHFAAYLERVEKTPQYKETLKGEAKGLADLKAGKYRVVLNPEKPRN